MDNMEAKLSAMMGNPELMAQVQQLAQSLQQGGPAEEAQQTSQPSDPPAGTMPDMGMVRELSSLMGSSQISGEQKTLLRALAPYLSSQRISRLERAMRAARMAGMASGIFQGGR